MVDLSSGQCLSAGELPSVVSIEWVQDGSSILYTIPDADGRPHKARSVLDAGQVLVSSPSTDG